MNALFLVIRAAAFYLVPTMIGSGWLWLARRKPVRISQLGVSFVIGSMALFGGALVIEAVVSAIPTVSFFQTLLAYAAILFSISLLINLFHFRQWWRCLQMLRWRHLVVAFMILCFSAMSYGIWLWRTPYPLNWDLYEHQTLVNLIHTDHFNFFTSHISDTFGFNSYPPVFHTVMAISQFSALSPIESLEYWNIVSFFHLLTVSFASYLFAYAITRRRVIAFLSCVIGTFAFESVMAFTAFFLLPQTLTTVLCIFALAQLFSAVHQQQKTSWWTALFWIFALILNHYVIGGLAAVLYLTAFICQRYPRTWGWWMRTFPFILAIVVVMTFGVIASYFVNFGSINQGEAASYIFSLSDKLNFLQRTYGYALFIFLPIGIYAILRHAKLQTQYALLMTMGFIAILLSNFPYVFKFYTLGSFFFHLIMAIGIWAILEKITSRFLRYIGMILLVGLLVILLIVNSVYWKHGLYSGSEYRHVSQDDLQAMNFILTHYPVNNTLLISDPATQYIFSALTRAHSDGGVFASTAMRDAVLLATKSEPAQAAQELSTIDTKIEDHAKYRLFIVSGRLFQWSAATQVQQHSFDYNQWQSVNLAMNGQIYAQKLSADKDDFRLIYQDNSNIIFELN